MTESKRPNQGKAAKDLNATIRYTMWSVFKLRDVLGEADRVSEAAEVEKLFAELEAADVTVRGLYDVAGLRADADLMVWWHAGTPTPRNAAPAIATPGTSLTAARTASTRSW